MAQAQDEDRLRELARAMPELFNDDEDGRRPAPPLNEWGIVPGLLANIYDRLAEVINAQVAAGGGDPQKVRPFPRPRTAMDVVRRELEVAEQAELFGMVRYSDD